DRLVDFHLQHFAGAFASPSHVQRILVEALAIAAVAWHFNVGQEAHFQRAHALSLADRAAALAGIEGKARRRPAPDAGFAGIGKQLADVVPESHIGGGAGAWRLADRGLIHFEHPVYPFPALD